MPQPKKKSLLYIADSFPPEIDGGAAVMVYELASYPWKDFVVTVITSTLESKQLQIEKKPWGTEYRIPASKTTAQRRFIRTLFLNEQARRAIELICQIKPDIIHAHNIHEFFSFSLLAEIRKFLPKTKLLLTMHDAMSIAYGKVDIVDKINGRDTPKKIPLFQTIKSAGFSFVPFRLWLIKRYLRAVDNIVVVSHSLESYLNANGVRNTTVIHNGISKNNKHIKVPKTMERIFKESKSSRWILFSGRISTAKGVLQLLKAFTIVQKTLPQVKLLIVGEAHSGLLKANVYATGWVKHEIAYELYRYADLCVVPSLYLDPFPTTVLEAASQKCPLVVTCFGGAKEAVRDGLDGYLVNPYNENELANRILKLLSNKKLATQMATAAFQRWENEFSLKPFIQKHLTLYKGE